MTAVLDVEGGYSLWEAAQVKTRITCKRSVDTHLHADYFAISFTTTLNKGDVSLLTLVPHPSTSKVGPVVTDVDELNPRSSTFNFAIYDHRSALSRQYLPIPIEPPSYLAALAHPYLLSDPSLPLPIHAY